MPPNSGNFQLVDVHGAGAQRSDPKFGDPDDWPYGHGPQGDVIRIYNHIRLVRDLQSAQGDINGDSEINIQDIIITVNLILNNEYNNQADLNSDSTVDILDIVHLVNIIIN